MTLNERLREAFDKRVCGTAMLPASDLLSAMTAIEQAEAENAALKEQVTNAKYSYLGAMADCKRYEETIEQQAAVIEQMREALRHYAYRAGQDWQIAREALALQPSPEILQARDERVAEACAKVCIEQSEGIARSTPVSRDRVHTLVESTMFKGIARPATVIDCSESSVRESAFRIRNGAWERHL